MIKTVISDGTEQCVTGLGGSNTVIVNFGSSELYASVKPDIVPDGRNVAAIPAGGVVNLRDTNGAVYLLGTGRVQLEGTTYGAVNVSMPSAGGGSGTVFMDGAAMGLVLPEPVFLTETAETTGEV
ncbi:MAG: hypothetical protein K1W18_14110 [Oscillospiraceae bacterium]